MALDLYSEPYRPEGNIDGRAATRAIGSVRLDPWTMFLRETLQNSWDAKLPRRSVSFDVDSFTADREQMGLLRDEVFASRPPRSPVLREALGRGATRATLLVVTDRGTRGLQGPTRADRHTDDRTDFVDFARNIGRAEDKELGGGTYGFGKGVLFAASTCSTVLLFTRTTFRDTPVSRFMAIHLGPSFRQADHRYTGRHWWGVAKGTGLAEPVTGRRAESLAASLGMARIPSSETGTSFAVLAPDPGEAGDLAGVTRRLADAASFWAWPHMVGTGGRPTIRFSFSHEGNAIEGIDPRTHPLLRHHVRAYERVTDQLAGRDIDAGWPWTDTRIRSERPISPLGVLSYRRTSDTTPDGEPEWAPRLGSHIALMRKPRFVVKYLEVQADPSGQATAGVFVTEPSQDEVFALSEPVAHDDWVPAQLQLAKFAKNPVKIALSKIRDELRQASRPPTPVGGAGFTAGATRLASAMGDLLAGAGPGTDARFGPVTGARSGKESGSARRPSSSGAGTPPRAVVDGEPTLLATPQGVVAEFPVLISVPDDGSVDVRADARVVLDGGGAEKEGQGPAGAGVPEVLGWRDATGGSWPGPVADVAGPGERRLVLRVRQPADAAVGVQLRLERR